MTDYHPTATAEYFDDLGVGEWERLVQTPNTEVKLHLHAHYLTEHLRRGDRILEVGAGAGRFTEIMAGLGARITVGDLSNVQLDLNRRFADERGFAHAVEGWHVLDICDLSRFDDNAFDGLVCYGGPLSYVFDARDQALAECVRVTRPGGRIWASVMSTWGSAHESLPAVVPLEAETLSRILTEGNLTAETLPGSRHHCHMFRAAEFRALLMAHGIEILDMSASNCLTTTWDLAAYRTDDAQWAEILRIEIEAAREPGCWDMGSHLIAVGTTPMDAEGDR